MSFIGDIRGRIFGTGQAPVAAPAAVAELAQGSGKGRSDEPESPSTFVHGGGNVDRNMFFTKQERTPELMKQYRTIYRQGGVVAQCIDVHALYALMNGYHVEGEDENDVALIEEVLEKIDFLDLVEQAIIDALVEGDAFQEVVPTRGGFPVGAVAPRDASEFTIQYDDYGNVLSYTQTVDLGAGRKQVIKLDPDQIIHITLHQSGGSVYGDSLIGRCRDDIYRDAQVMQGTTQAIMRHGFPKFHISVAGTDDGTGRKIAPPRPVMQQTVEQFRNISAKNEFVTTDQLDIKELDSGGVSNLSDYNEVSLKRLAAAMGVPSDVLGIKEGSSLSGGSASSKRIDTFYKKIAAFQRKVAMQYNELLVDRILGPDKEDSVRIVFNQIEGDDMAIKAQAVQTLMKIDPTNPEFLITRAQAYDMLGLNIDDYQPEVPEDIPETGHQPAPAPVDDKGVSNDGSNGSGNVDGGKSQPDAGAAP